MKVEFLEQALPLVLELACLPLALVLVLAWVRQVIAPCSCLLLVL
jgi:hypothetical protein